MKKRYIILSLLLGAFTVASSAAIISYVLEGYQAPHATGPLQIPSYVPNSVEVVHPDIVHVPSRWHGYEYWMSYTPYPNSVSSKENPSIVASHDGMTWAVPAGLTNPVADVYTGTDTLNNYNSDSDLVLSPDGQTLQLVWRRLDGWSAEVLNVKTSTNGINWSAKTQILRTSVRNDAAYPETVISPAIVWTGSKYYLWTVNIKTTQTKVVFRQANSITGPWSSPVETDIGLMTGNLRVWHLDVVKYNGIYHMLASCGRQNQVEGKDLFLGKSTNGINWTFSTRPLLSSRTNTWDDRIYRSTCLIEEKNGRPYYRIWYSCMNSPKWRIGYTEAHDTTSVYPPLNLKIQQNGNPATGIKLLWDLPIQNVTGFAVYRNNEKLTIPPLKTNSYIDPFSSLSSNSSLKQLYQVRSLWEDAP